jgi:hypothetical protein
LIASIVEHHAVMIPELGRKRASTHVRADRSAPLVRRGVRLILNPGS